MIKIQIKGFQELSKRFASAPNVFKGRLKATMLASLYVIWQNVPAYPPQSQDSTYARTGLLGKSFGVDMSGDQSGGADIFEVKELSGYITGAFGSNLHYAQYVVGENQKSIFGRLGWWNISGLAKASRAGIQELFRILEEGLRDYLEGR